MLQRFGAVLGVALASSVFSAYGAIGSPTGFTDGFRPGITVAAALALVGALAGLAVAAHKTKQTESPLRCSSQNRLIEPEPPPTSCWRVPVRRTPPADFNQRAATRAKFDSSSTSPPKGTDDARHPSSHLDRRRHRACPRARLDQAGRRGLVVGASGRRHRPSRRHHGDLLRRKRSRCSHGDRSKTRQNASSGAASKDPRDWKGTEISFRLDATRGRRHDAALHARRLARERATSWRTAAPTGAPT